MVMSRYDIYDAQVASHVPVTAQGLSGLLRLLELGDAGAQRFLRVERRRGIARGREHAGDRPTPVAQQREAEVDIQGAAVLVHRACGQHLPRVLRDTTRERLVEALPVRRAQAVGNDEIEALSQRL